MGHHLLGGILEEADQSRRPTGGFWGGAAAAIFFTGPIGTIGAALVAWRKGWPKVAAILAGAGILWSATVAVAVLVSVNGGGASAPGPTGGQMQGKVLTFAKTIGGQSQAASAQCAMPSAWTPGKAFQCFVYNSGGTGLGEVTVTILDNSGNEYRWNMSWLPTGAGAASTPTAAPTAAGTPGQATFSVTGSAPDGVTITYGTNTSNLSGGPLPFTVTLPLSTAGGVLYYDITAQLQGAGGISCSISVGGKVISSGTASGGYNICMSEIYDSNGTWISS